MCRIDQCGVGAMSGPGDSNAVERGHKRTLGACWVKDDRSQRQGSGERSGQVTMQSR